jgi:hypothetical protein
MSSDRFHIDKLDEFLRSHVGDLSSGSVHVSYLEDPTLKKEAREYVDFMCSTLRKEKLTEKQFDSLFSASVSETKTWLQRSSTSSVMLKGSQEETWLTDERKAQLGWVEGEVGNYRQRYFDYLQRHVKRSEKHVMETQRSTLKIIEQLGDPIADHRFSSRGLVVGPVQGGKTENFNGVIASAIDVGYHLTIVFSGIMEDLRVQTQSRVEDDVVGKQIEGVWQGVAQDYQFNEFSSIPEHRDVKTVSVLTSKATDFKTALGSQEADIAAGKLLLICKKNQSILKQILIWLQGQLLERENRISLLIIDDEADNASLNNYGEKGRQRASKINALLRSILGLFEKNAYVGYTASPFANILQFREKGKQNLPEEFVVREKTYRYELAASVFPKDFIQLITPPPNYIGTKEIFRTRSEHKKIEPMLAPMITDDLKYFPQRLEKDSLLPTRDRGRGTRAANRHDPFPESLPPSLKEAIFCFILATAIRLSRKEKMYKTVFYQPHNTMLIHVSRFINWQTTTKKLVDAFVKDLVGKIALELPSSKTGIYSEFERHFNSHFATSMLGMSEYLQDDYIDDFLSPVSFEKIKPLLSKVAKDINVLALNSEPPKDQLNYKDRVPQTVIAIGGNRLSRGFTLEGLTVSYFIRDTSFSDTLLQMGRWFGYRPGYVDCCKIFMTGEAMDKFDSISMTVEDLTEKLSDMSRDPLNKPENYSLKVLSHPGALKLTRNSILKNAEAKSFTYSDQFIQTTKFKLHKARVIKAYEAFCLYTREIHENFKEIDNALVYREASSEIALDLLALEGSYFDHDLDEVSRYIKACNDDDKLIRWTIAINMRGTGEVVDSEKLGFQGHTIKSITRQISVSSNARSEAIELLKNEQTWVAGGRSSNIHSASDLKVALSRAIDIEEAENEFLEEKRRKLREDYPGASEADIDKKISGTSIPEGVYRRKMPSTHGVIVIYLIDSNKIFVNKDQSPIEELESSKVVLGTSVPLVALAVGIPKIDNDPLAQYMESKDHTKSLEAELEAENEELGSEIDDLDALDADFDEIIGSHD